MNDKIYIPIDSTAMTPEQIIANIAWPFQWRLEGHKGRVEMYAKTLKNLGMTDYFVAELIWQIYMDAFSEADLQRNKNRKFEIKSST